MPSRAARAAFEAGTRDAGRLRQIMTDVLATEPLAEPQYVSCAHPDTLTELDTVTDRALLSMVVYVGDTRLIDNVLLE